VFLSSIYLITAARSLVPCSNAIDANRHRTWIIWICPCIYDLLQTTIYISGIVVLVWWNVHVDFKSSTEKQLGSGLGNFTSDHIGKHKSLLLTGILLL